MRKRRTVAGLVLAAASIAVAIVVSSAFGASKAATLTVWLQVDAQGGPWGDIVNDTNAKFKAQTGVNVDVQYQTWGTHLAKFDATLASGNVPDVIEMGNTEMTAYMAAGAFSDITGERGSFDNSANWLGNLKGSSTYNGRLYGVPYYAGSRLLTYRSDLFRTVPNTTAKLIAAAKRVGAKNKKKTFSPIYLAGTDWYTAMAFVFDYGGSIAAIKRGQWVGTLNTKKSMRGIAAWQRFFRGVSRAAPNSNEGRPAPYEVYAQGLAGGIIGPGWFSCCVGDTYKARTKQAVIPGAKAGQVLPGFVGGSDLAIPAKTNQRASALAWIRIYTSTEMQRRLQAIGNIPNATNLLGNSIAERAVKRSWFVPTARGWVAVENGNVLRTMLSSILSRKLTIKQAATVASDNIAQTLNA